MCTLNNVFHLFVRDFSILYYIINNTRCWRIVRILNNILQSTYESVIIVLYNMYIIYRRIAYFIVGINVPIILNSVTLMHIICEKAIIVLSRCWTHVYINVNKPPNIKTTEKHTSMEYVYIPYIYVKRLNVSEGIYITIDIRLNNRRPRGRAYKVG